MFTQSNHQEYLRTNLDVCEVRRPCDYPITKYDVLLFRRYEYTKTNVENVGTLIKDNLTPSLISEQFEKKYPTLHSGWKRPLFGYCVPASFALLFFMNTNQLHPFQGKDLAGEKHWWLEDVNTRQRFDLTSVQYSKEELEFVYRTGKPKRMYGFKGRPQSRILDLMKCVQPNSQRYFEFVQPKGTLEDFL